MTTKETAGTVVVFYSHIRPAHGQTVADVIRRAHVLGYELMPFSGWDNADIGYAGNRGPHFVAARANGQRCGEIQDACIVETPEGPDWPHILYTVDGPDAPHADA